MLKIMGKKIFTILRSIFLFCLNLCTQSFDGLRIQQDYETLCKPVTAPRRANLAEILSNILFNEEETELMCLRGSYYNKMSGSP